MTKTEIAFKILVYSGAIDSVKGFCFALYYSLLELGYDIGEANSMSEDEADSMGKCFPEIYKHKPMNAVGYWWPQYDREIRIRILQDEIEKLFDKL